MDKTLRSHLLRHGLAIENVTLIEKTDAGLVAITDLAHGAATMDDAREWAGELGLVTVAVKTCFMRSWLDAYGKVEKTGAASHASEQDRAAARKSRESRRAEAQEQAVKAEAERKTVHDRLMAVAAAMGGPAESREEQHGPAVKPLLSPWCRPQRGGRAHSPVRARRGPSSRQGREAPRPIPQQPGPGRELGGRTADGTEEVAPAARQLTAQPESLGPRAVAAQPPPQLGAAGQQMFSISTPRPTPRPSLEPAPRGATGDGKALSSAAADRGASGTESLRPERIAGWSLHQVLTKAKPQWSAMDAHFCELRLRKSGISSVADLAEALALDLNQLLRDQGRGGLAGSSIAALRKLLWEDPDAEAFGEEVGDECDAEPWDWCAELVAELLVPIRASLAPFCLGDSKASAGGAKERRRRPRDPPRRPAPKAPACRVEGGDMLSQLLALEEDSGDEAVEEEEKEEEEEEEEPPLPPPQELAEASADQSARGDREEQDSRPSSSTEAPQAVSLAAEDGHGSDAECDEGLDGEQADIFDAPAEVWRQTQASPQKEVRSRPPGPERHQLASLCGWEGEGETHEAVMEQPRPGASGQQSAYEIFDAPARDWLLLPKQAEEASAAAAQPSSSSDARVARPSTSEAKPGEADEAGRRFKRETMIQLTQTPQLARSLGAATGIAMAFQLAVLSRSFRDWMLRVLPGLIAETPPDVFLLGGHSVNERWSAGSTLMRLCVRTLTWEPLPPMSTKRTCATAVSAMGKVYVVGGFDGRRLLDTAERFDLSSRTWEALPPMSAPRYTCGAGAILGSVYVIGGVGNQALPHDAYERFDPTLQRWEPVPPTSLGCSTDVAVAAVRQRLYVLGFLDGRSEFERLNPGAEKWERLEPLQPGLAKNVLTGAVGIGDRLYVCSARILAIRIFNCRLDYWEPPPSTGLDDNIRAGRSISVTTTGGRLFIVGTWLEKAGRRSDSREREDGGPTLGCVTYTAGAFETVVSRCLRTRSSRGRMDGRSSRRTRSRQGSRRGAESPARSWMETARKGWQHLQLDGYGMHLGCSATAARS